MHSFKYLFNTASSSGSAIILWQPARPVVCTLSDLVLSELLSLTRCSALHGSDSPQCVWQLSKQEFEHFNSALAALDNDEEDGMDHDAEADLGGYVPSVTCSDIHCIPEYSVLVLLLTFYTANLHSNSESGVTRLVRRHLACLTSSGKR